MKFFIDTANLKEISDANDLGILDGVTTNPSSMAKEGIVGAENINNHYKNICEIVNGDVSAEVISIKYEDMIREGEMLAKLHKNIVVKIPMIRDGIKAIKYLSSKDVKTNCTLVFTAGQALIASKAGATYVSPFVGRLDDLNQDGVSLIGQIAHIFKAQNSKTQILAASVRGPLHIVKCAELGADAFTSSLDSIVALLKHPLTDIGLEKFLADYQKVNK